MKVVLFCGGYGMRMRSGDTDLPKPMQQVGPRPLLWHVMRYYAHYGHKDFILCLGYGAHHIKEYFLNYQETASNDFVLDRGELRLLGSDIADWNITFVHTGLDTPIGERLRRVREHVEGEEMFLANYADVLTDVPLDTVVDTFAASDAGASLVAVSPQAVFHCVDIGQDNKISRIQSARDLSVWVNGGYFALRQEVFDHLPPGGDLVADACTALAKQDRLLAYPYSGFWQSADTIKERNELEAAYQAGTRPWMVWEREADRSPLAGLVAQNLAG